MKQAQESEQLSSSRSQSQSQSKRNFKIESTITEQGLAVRVLSDVNEHHTNVYEGMVDKKQLTNDGSPIADNFNTLEDIQ